MGIYRSMTVTPSSLPLTSPTLRLVSWNLFHEDGATLDDICLLIRMTKPDILLMQEARPIMDKLPERIKGYYSRVALPGRLHGTACWSRIPFSENPLLFPLPPGLIVQRSAQILKFHGYFGPFSIANVHLSHGQILNRRQLRIIRNNLQSKAVIIGDFNIFGPALLPGFRDIGPKATTHRMLNRVPFRLDRCLAHGFTLLESRAYPRFGSDHHPIAVTLSPNPIF